MEAVETVSKAVLYPKLAQVPKLHTDVDQVYVLRAKLNVLQYLVIQSMNQNLLFQTIAINFLDKILASNITDVKTALADQQFLIIWLIATEAHVLILQDVHWRLLTNVQQVIA